MTEFHPSKRQRFWVGIASGTLPVVMLAVAAGWAYSEQAEYKAKVKERDMVLAEMERKISAAQAELDVLRTSLRQAGDQLDNVAARDVALFELRQSAGHGYASLDPQGRVMEWNPALEKWTGYSQEEMVGKDIKRLMAERAGEKHVTSYAEVLADPKAVGRTFTLECELVPRDPNKRPIPVRVNARIVQPPTGERYAIALVDRVSRIINLSDTEEDQ